MIRTARSVRRRIAVGAVVIGLSAIAPATASLGAGAAAAPGSGLGSENVHALAIGLRMPLYSHQGEDGEVQLPYALSDLSGGGLAHALTSFVWPGATGASLGSTLGVLAGQIPQNVQNALNDPVKAEAPTTQGATSVSFSQPGFIMQALALPTHVNSSTALGLSQVSSFANNAGPLITATTNIGFKGTNEVVADASTALNDITIGPLSIGSLVSTAHATSDGKHATGFTTTNIAGVKVAGVSVTIGHDGVELANKGVLPASVVNTLTKTVNTALKTAGLQIYVTPSSQLAHGSAISLDSGDLVILLHRPQYRSNFNDTGVFMELGGASITANATGGYVAPALPSASPSTAATTGGTPSGPTNIPNPPSLGTGTTTLPTGPVPVPAVAASPLSLRPLSSWWVVLGTFAALLTAFLLSLLPGRALVAGAGCRLEEES